MNIQMFVLKATSKHKYYFLFQCCKFSGTGCSCYVANDGFFPTQNFITLAIHFSCNIA